MCHNVKALICIHKAQKWYSTTIPLKPVCLFLIRPFTSEVTTVLDSVPTISLLFLKMLFYM